MSTGYLMDVRESGLNLEEVYQRARNKRGLMAVLGREARNATTQNFRSLTERGNKFDAPSTGYWENAALATSFTVLTDATAVVSTNQVGVRLHYLGGNVKPVTKKWLTIPAIAAAHGHRATEFQNLWLMKKGGQPIALARTVSTKPPKFEVVYWLRKSVKHLPDHSTLPGPAALADRLRAQAASYINREVLRKGGIA